MAAQYHRGRRFEWEVRATLLELGWHVIRAAGSKTKADLVAMRGGATLLLQAKRTGWPGPAERMAIAKVAQAGGATAYAVSRGDRATLLFRRIWSDGSLADRIESAASFA